MPRYATRKQQPQEQENSSPGAEYVPSSSNENSEDEIQRSQQLSFSSTSNSILMITEQEALATDTYSKNGRSGRFNISAKNVPLKIRISSTVNLRSNPLSAELVYEQDGSPVISPSNQPHPLEWSLVIGSNEFTGVLTARILVLSTQHQGSLFNIKLTCQGQSVLSVPIRVISKRSHALRIVERQKRQAQQILGDDEQIGGEPEQTHPTTKTNKRKRNVGVTGSRKYQKTSDDDDEEFGDFDEIDNEDYSPPLRTTSATQTYQPTTQLPPPHHHVTPSVMVPVQQNQSNDQVLKALSEIKAQQQVMLERLNKSTPTNPAVTTISTNVKTETSYVSLESSFRALVRAYIDTPLHERAERMRKIAHESFENEQVATELCQICLGSANNLGPLFGNTMPNTSNQSNPETLDFGSSMLTSSTGVGHEYNNAFQMAQQV